MRSIGDVLAVQLAFVGGQRWRRCLGHLLEDFVRDISRQHRTLILGDSPEHRTEYEKHLARREVRQSVFADGSPFGLGQIAVDQRENRTLLRRQVFVQRVQHALDELSEIVALGDAADGLVPCRAFIDGAEESMQFLMLLLHGFHHGGGA